MKKPAGPRAFPVAALLLSLVPFAWFVFAVLPGQSEAAGAYTPEGAAFDTSFFYTPREAVSKVSRYSVENRLAYIAARWTFDLAWPVAYGLFAFCGWAYALDRFRVPRRWRTFGAAITLLGPCFDYAENIAVTVLMAAPPGDAEFVAVAASSATLLKWIFVVPGIAGAMILPPVARILPAILGGRRDGDAGKTARPDS